jgi:hypothetical protein
LTGATRASYRHPSIRHRDLQDLLAAAASLPGERVPAPPLRDLPAPPAPGPVAGARVVVEEMASTDRASVRAVRADLARLLTDLSRALDEALPEALARATWMWDQVDSEPLLSDGFRADVVDTRARLNRAAQAPSAAVRAVAAEALVALSAALALVELFERRLPSLIRLRTRAEDPTLVLTGGRPFLDVPAALAEVARGWT